MANSICRLHKYNDMAKEIRVGKTTKLIRETEKDISGLPLLMETEDTSVKNPIPEEITAPVADIIEDETLHEEKPVLSPDDVQPPKEPLDEAEIIITETEESKERKRKNKKNFLLLALGGLALLFVANS